MGNAIVTRLRSFQKKMQLKTASMIGYPINTGNKYRQLNRFFDYSLINLGDPFTPSSYRINAEDFEVEVLTFFASLYKMPKDDFWGYVTSGGTEGNMHGIFIGRELYPNALLYFSKDTHYSISKIARLLHIQTVIVDSQENGEIDYVDLEKKLIENRSRPAILNLNIGTTMKGAIDDVGRIVAMLARVKIAHFHIHCDAALFGMILPFLEKAPSVDFSLPIGSLAISGHKFMGVHIPCGIALSRKKLIKAIDRPIDYIGSNDTTITGCRNGHASLLLWYIIQKKGYRGFEKEANTCIKNASYLADGLSRLDWPNLLNPYSNIVVMKKPSFDVVKKWQLATCGSLAHVVVMPSVTKNRIRQFISDVSS